MESFKHGSTFMHEYLLCLILIQKIMIEWLSVRWALNDLAGPPSAGRITKGQGAVGLARVGDEAPWPRVLGGFFAVLFSKMLQYSARHLNNYKIGAKKVRKNNLFLTQLIPYLVSH